MGQPSQSDSATLPPCSGDGRASFQGYVAQPWHEGPLSQAAETKEPVGTSELAATAVQVEASGVEWCQF